VAHFFLAFVKPNTQQSSTSVQPTKVQPEPTQQVQATANPSQEPTSAPTVTGAMEHSASNGAMMMQESSAKTTITIQNYAFGPKTTTVKVGTTVTFINKDAVSHTATADDKSFDTGLIAQNAQKTVTFSKPGTYSYYCRPHPNMRATIVVQ
jgi:plastocyanin